MPQTRILVYCDERKQSPLLEWMDELKRRNRAARAKCVSRIFDLERDGHELRRPLSDYLRDGIRELRVRIGRVNYRLLYSFHGRDVAILTHGITKEDAVPADEIEFAIMCMEKVRKNPEKHTIEFPG